MEHYNAGEESNNQLYQEPDWSVNLSKKNTLRINDNIIDIFPPEGDDSNTGHLYTVNETFLTPPPELSRVTTTKYLSFQQLTFFLIELFRDNSSQG